MDRVHHVEKIIPLTFAKFIRTGWWRSLPVHMRLGLARLWRAEQEHRKDGLQRARNGLRVAGESIRR
jgi:hypothetical protein